MPYYSQSEYIHELIEEEREYSILKNKLIEVEVTAKEGLKMLKEELQELR